MESIWKKSAPKVDFEALNGKKSTDVLIVGGGIAGILCAYKLKNAGVDCILAEADRICNGITKNTTAKITIAHGLIYDKLIKRFGEDRARLYLEAQLRAVEEYKLLCKNIDCDYEIKNSYVYSLSGIGKIEKETYALNRLGVKAEFSNEDVLPFSHKGAVRLKEQAQFHPLKFLKTVAKDLPIYENTKVVQLMPYKALTNQGEISYKKIIIATHFPILNKHGAYFLKLYQHRSYVIALKNAQNVDGMYVDEASGGLSFRNYKDLLLIGGGAHRTGKNGGAWEELEKFRDKYYGNSKIVGKWATQDCMTLDGIPYIGQYSKSTKDIYVATGFNKWGMTNAMLAADILCDLACDKPNPYATVFSPSRSMLHPQLALNAWESLLGLLTPTAPRCPHLGCAL
ncbi:MAG: FAD-binding oxidoreductase, partial [Clostridia bacterium]|nr:FAD-binding oxidoreductase [Clostridia bacterium]